jgi:hypothetical protein
MTDAHQAADQPADSGGPADRVRGLAAVAVAVVLLLGFAALLLYLVGEASSATDATWSRYVYLFGALEALVFTAVGWLFGREVNRQAVQHAEKRAAQADSKAEDAVGRAAEQEANGRALRTAVEARAGELSTSIVEDRGIGGGGARDDRISELVTLARALFPPR